MLQTIIKDIYNGIDKNCNEKWKIKLTFYEDDVIEKDFDNNLYYQDFMKNLELTGNLEYVLVKFNELFKKENDIDFLELIVQEYIDVEEEEYDGYIDEETESEIYGYHKDIDGFLYAINFNKPPNFYYKYDRIYCLSYEFIQIK